ncbi:MAG: endonuclease/exonuclease/phosphatase family protein [Limnochordia bacterium]|nr:endonuclease/exonuclease/phosphatase family protein [Limnochordia bacterium]NLO94473.1 endonuclease/exonuclease/phosphatase family protein [Bacillota bacterium]HOB41510.1 endonuclease/exonuclease/phosphatase family protein [Limnochordia bacterium]HOK32720.1 endonuclease/exonuclease/phosphatase family protein [Limnochordia bacterium]HOM01152.1 endonuclease/exonuclease/phosphatase family protein [Limnochordia bacterium]
MKFLLRAVVSLLVLTVLLCGGLILYLSITEYKPAEAMPVQILQQQNRPIDAASELTITTFNIGYAALERDVDFFMDGGTMSRGLSKGRVEQNLNKIIQVLQSLDSDFYLLQEVDEKSTRSFGINQRENIAKALPDYVSSYAVNYQVGWVPVPLTQPMGRVLSGLQTLSRYTVHEATRYALPSTASWPVRLAHLKRCLLETRIPVTNGRELVIAHVHLEAFDGGGELRSQQLAFVESYARAELAKGNYVLLGGDWNHLLAVNPQEVRARHSASWPPWLQLLPEDFLAGFAWAYDQEVPSVRTLEAPYDPLRTFTCTIDGFLVSPNIEILEVQGHDLGFEFSDHNPVTLRFRLQDDTPAQEAEENQGQE